MKVVLVVTLSFVSLSLFAESRNHSDLQQELEQKGRKRAFTISCEDRIGRHLCEEMRRLREVSKNATGRQAELDSAVFKDAADSLYDDFNRFVDLEDAVTFEMANAAHATAKEMCSWKIKRGTYQITSEVRDAANNAMSVLEELQKKGGIRKNIESCRFEFTFPQPDYVYPVTPIQPKVVPVWPGSRSYLYQRRTFYYHRERKIYYSTPLKNE